MRSTTAPSGSNSNTPRLFSSTCAALSALLPVPLATVQHWGDAWIKPEHLVNNGPFTLEAEWRINDHIRLQKNPRYWDRDNVRLNTVDALPISQANVALNFFAAGLCDLIMDKGLVPADASSANCARSRIPFRAVPGQFFPAVQLLASAVQRPARAAGVFAGGG